LKESKRWASRRRSARDGRAIQMSGRGDESAHKNVGGWRRWGETFSENTADGQILAAAIAPDQSAARLAIRRSVKTRSISSESRWASAISSTLSGPSASAIRLTISLIATSYWRSNCSALSNIHGTVMRPGGVAYQEKAKPSQPFPTVCAQRRLTPSSGRRTPRF
jgi:hypothetical protein